MGSDASVTGTVLEILPSAIYRVELETRAQVLAHAAGARIKNFVRLRPGDRVEVVISAHDRTRGRIVRVFTERS
ncbi:MAG TPA: translation initiation factor IF-1 [Bryobacteraceae bacterium]|nr:translation initiation factor IF-1 [Bryobacteraceae bacterium]